MGRLVKGASQFRLEALLFLCISNGFCSLSIKIRNFPPAPGSKKINNLKINDVTLESKQHIEIYRFFSVHLTLRHHLSFNFSSSTVRHPQILASRQPGSYLMEQFCHLIFRSDFQEMFLGSIIPMVTAGIPPGRTTSSDTSGFILTLCYRLSAGFNKQSVCSAIVIKA